MIELKDLKVKAIIYPNGEYQLGRAVPIIDEGPFYRIDGTHIFFDKFRIKNTVLAGNKLTVDMRDKVVVLEVEE